MAGRLIGNEALLQSLQESAKAGRLSHGYVVEGPEGSGKFTLACHIARLALCTGSSKPCGKCPHCIKLQKNIHPDLQVIAPPEGKSTIGVEQIKQLRGDMYIAPNEGEKKVYIIRQAEKMTPAAQNALLKSLEEPPSYVVLVLCVLSRDMLLPVVLSRCVHLAMAPVPQPLVEEALAMLCPSSSKEERRQAAALSNGIIGRGLSILEDPSYLQQAERCLNFLQRLAVKDREGVVTFQNQLEKQKDGFAATLSVLREMLYDVMMAKIGRSPAFVHKTTEITELASELTMQGLVAMYDLTYRCEERVRGNGNHALTVQMLIQGCWEEMR
jgi:DNA polymerase-3 subunit delta'